MVILGIQDVGKTAFMVSSKLSLSGRNGPFFINVLNLRGLDGYKVDGDGYLERRREVKVLRNGTPVTAEVEHRRMDGTGPHGAFSIGWMEYPGGRLSDIEFIENVIEPEIMAAKEEGHPVCVVMVDGSKAMSEGPVEAPGFNEQGFPVNRKKYENGKEYLKEALEHTVGLIDPSIADGLPLRLVITKRDLIEEAHPNRNDFNRITRSMGSRATCLVDDIIAKNAEEEEVDGGFEFDFMARFSSTAAEYYEAELPAKILIDYLENQR